MTLIRRIETDRTRLLNLWWRRRLTPATSTAKRAGYRPRAVTRIWWMLRTTMRSMMVVRSNWWNRIFLRRRTRCSWCRKWRVVCQSRSKTKENPFLARSHSSRLFSRQRQRTASRYAGPTWACSGRIGSGEVRKVPSASVTTLSTRQIITTLCKTARKTAWWSFRIDRPPQIINCPVSRWTCRQIGRPI